MACNGARKQGKKIYCLSDFRHSIRIFTPDIESTEGDYIATDKNEIVKARAKIITRSGGEFFNGTAMQETSSHHFIIRFIGLSFSKNDIIQYRNANYKILSIENENEDSKFLKFRASKLGDGTVQQESNWA